MFKINADDIIYLKNTNDNQCKIICLGYDYLVEIQALFDAPNNSLNELNVSYGFLVKKISNDTRVTTEGFASLDAAISAIKQHATELAKQDIQQTLQRYGIIEQQDGDSND
jgi:hypothetical protein